MKDPNQDPKTDPKEDRESLQDFLREVQTVARKAFENAFARREPSLLLEFEEAIEKAQTAPFQSQSAKESARDKLAFFKLFCVLDLGLQNEEEAQTLRRFVQFVRKNFLASFVSLVPCEMRLEDARDNLREALDAFKPFANQLESLELLPAVEKVLNAFDLIQETSKKTKDLLHEMAKAGRLIETPQKWQTCAGLSEEESKRIFDAWQDLLPEMKRRAGL